MIAAALLLAVCARADNHAAGPEMLPGFEPETSVTAAWRETPADEAPATVHILTAEDLQASGARTLWDALRAVPGLDVVATRAMQGELGMRGLAQTLGNRVLVLLDGRTVLNGYFDNAFLEELPVPVEEIDRIEVVEGPASALYGANALSGVVNILTKTPAQLNGGAVGTVVGEHRMAQSFAMGGRRFGAFALKASAEWRTANRFEEPDRIASRVSKAHAAGEWSLGDDAALGLSGGGADIWTQLSSGNYGPVVADGPTGYLRADGRWRWVRVSGFWNRSRQVAREFLVLDEPRFEYDLVDASAQVTPPRLAGHQVTLGAGGRWTAARSGVFAPGWLRQRPWAGWAEDAWRPVDRVAVTASGRWDHHPVTGGVLSPRAAVVVEAARGHFIRVTGGRSYRNPTLLQQHLDFRKTFPWDGALPPNPPFTGFESHLAGNPDLEPERMTHAEAGWNGRWDRVRTTLAVWRWRLAGIITLSTIDTVALVPPVFHVRQSYANGPPITAEGGEAGAEWLATRWLSVFGSWSHQRLHDPQGIRDGEAPRDKGTAGARFRHAGWTLNLWTHLVDSTRWTAPPPGQPRRYERIPGYALVNAYAEYEFRSLLPGASLGLGAFNLGGTAHEEILGHRSAATPGQGGERLGSRWTGSLTWRF